jgi:hypothetical protein
MNCTETGVMLPPHRNIHCKRNSAQTPKIGADKELDHDRAQTQLLLTLLSPEILEPTIEITVHTCRDWLFM